MHIELRESSIDAKRIAPPVIITQSSYICNSVKRTEMQCPQDTRKQVSLGRNLITLRQQYNSGKSQMERILHNSQGLLKSNCKGSWVDMHWQWPHQVWLFCGCVHHPITANQSSKLKAQLVSCWKSYRQTWTCTIFIIKCDFFSWSFLSF
jgi:hypothetical protein